MAADWYFQANGQTVGPVDRAVLKQLAQAGRLTSDVLVRKGPDGSWLPAQKVKGLFDGITLPQPGRPAPPAAFDFTGDTITEPVASTGNQQCRAPTALAAYGIATLVLASLWTLAGCTSGVAAVWCFAASAVWRADGEKTMDKAQHGAKENDPIVNAATMPTIVCCGAGQQFLGEVSWLVAVILSVVAAVHWLLAAGHFTVAVGVRRRRRWVRVPALVLSVFTGIYGIGIFWQIVSATLQSQSPTNSSRLESIAVGGVVGLVFLAHAVFTWVVMLQPACIQELRHKSLQEGDVLES